MFKFPQKSLYYRNTVLAREVKTRLDAEFGPMWTVFAGKGNFGAFVGHHQAQFARFSLGPVTFVIFRAYDMDEVTAKEASDQPGDEGLEIRVAGGQRRRQLDGRDDPRRHSIISEPRYLYQH